MLSDEQGLMSALQQWAGEVEDLFKVRCRFECFTPVLIHDDTAATHLYYIAREAVNNAIKHGDANQIDIRLAADHEQEVLTSPTTVVESKTLPPVVRGWVFT